MKLNDRSLDETLTALADPTRRAILARLMLSEARVTDLAAPFKMSLAAVSKHVSLLERASLVRRRRQWREHWLSYNPTPVQELAAWLNAQNAFWSARLDALEEALRKDRAPESISRGKRT